MQHLVELSFHSIFIDTTSWCLFFVTVGPFSGALNFPSACCVVSPVCVEVYFCRDTSTLVGCCLLMSGTVTPLLLHTVFFFFFFKC
jgi:hypothetical protein